MTAGFAICAATSFAHNPDTSYLRCRVGSHEMELRFTLDPATLHRIVRPDLDGDGRITRAEMDTMAPAIFGYLESGVKLEINGVPAGLGERRGLGWPAEAGDAIVEKDYQSRLLHFTFQCRSRALIEDFYVCYEVFSELGDRHRVIADIEQDGRHHEVAFAMFEPDYLYDTFRTPDTRELFRGYMAAAWGNPVLLLVVVSAIVLGAVRRSWVAVALAAAAGFAGLLWCLRGDLRPGSVPTFLCGIAAAMCLGAMSILPLFLGINVGSAARRKKTAPPEQAQQRSG